MKIFGERLKEMRIQKGITQKQAAYDMGMTFSAMSQYETGKRTPKNDILVKLATYFGVSVDYLLGMDKSPVKQYSYISPIQDGQVVSSPETHKYEATLSDEGKSINSDLSASKSRILNTLNKLPNNKQLEVLTAIELLLGTIIS